MEREEVKMMCLTEVQKILGKKKTDEIRDKFGKKVKNPHYSSAPPMILFHSEDIEVFMKEKEKLEILKTRDKIIKDGVRNRFKSIE